MSPETIPRPACPELSRRAPPAQRADSSLPKAPFPPRAQHAFCVPMPLIGTPSLLSRARRPPVPSGAEATEAEGTAPQKPHKQTGFGLSAAEILLQSSHVI
jgi:hypothetical protein